MEYYVAANNQKVDYVCWYVEFRHTLLSEKLIEK